MATRTYFRGCSGLRTCALRRLHRHPFTFQSPRPNYLVYVNTLLSVLRTAYHDRRS